MHKKIFGIEIRLVDDGCVHLTQKSDHPESDDQLIEISADQIDLLVKWLNEIKELKTF